MPGALNVKKIREQAQLHISSKIENQYALRFLNEGLTRIYTDYPKTACKRSFITIEAIKDEWIDIPVDIAGIVRCKKNNLDYGNYTVGYGQVIFNDTGTYTLGILIYPAVLTVETDTPEIPFVYHYCLSLFLAAREKQRLFGDEDSDSVRLMQEFFMSAQAADKMLSGIKKTPRKIKTQLYY